MKQIAAILVATVVFVSPIAAQQSDEDTSLMERGMELFFEGLREEMSPALESMRQMTEEYGPAFFSFLEEMGPAFGEMLDQVKDWAAYHPPEILPNGDIIMRKKQMPDPETEKEDVPPIGQTDI